MGEYVKPSGMRPNTVAPIGGGLGRVYVVLLRPNFSTTLKVEEELNQVKILDLGGC